MKITIDLPRQDVTALDRLEILSKRETTVFRLIGKGMKKSDLAARLGLSGNTVETHRQNMSQKLGLSGSHSLLKFAYENRSAL